MKGIHLPEIKSNGKTYRTNKLMFRSPDLRPSLLRQVDITEILLKRVKHHKPPPPPRELIESLDVLCPKLFHILSSSAQLLNHNQQTFAEKFFRNKRFTCLQAAVVVVIVWQWDLQLPMQSVPITTKIVSSIPVQARCTRYNIM